METFLSIKLIFGFPKWQPLQGWIYWSTGIPMSLVERNELTSLVSASMNLCKLNRCVCGLQILKPAAFQNKKTHWFSDDLRIAAPSLAKKILNTIDLVERQVIQ